MCKQWIPGPFFSGGSGLGTRLYFGVLSFIVQPTLLEVVEGPDTLNEHLLRLLVALVQTLHASVLSKSMVNVLSSLLQLRNTFEQ